MKNKLLKSIAVGGLTAVFMASPEAEGATMTVSPIQSNSSEYILDFSAANDRIGDVYDSAVINVVSALAQEIYALGNFADSSVDGMVNNDWGIQIRNPPAGEVDNAWLASSVGLGVVDLSNNGEIVFGSPACDTWKNTTSNSLQYTLGLRFAVNNDLLE